MASPDQRRVRLLAVAVAGIGVGAIAEAVLLDAHRVRPIEIRPLDGTGE
jgi:hypothetical protein